MTDAGQATPPEEPRRPSDSLASLGEFGLIERLSRLLPSFNQNDIPVGIGDDAAVVRIGSRILIATTDALLEGIHFRREWTSPEDLGWKALAVNLSDLAAMGGEPRFALLSLGLPAGTDLEWVEGFYRGMAELSALSRCAVLGGDTVTSPDRIYLNVTVIGESPEGRYATRDGARPGDALLVTGALGEALAGYLCLERGWGDSDDEAIRACLRAHRRPVPRLEAGIAAVRTGKVRAMMDVSDGLSGDVRHIASRSGAGIRIEAARLPLSDALRATAARLDRDATELALSGGEDYELLMTVSSEDVPVVRAAVEATGIALTLIGEVTDRPGEITVVRPDGSEEPLPRLSWDHFETRKDEA